MIDFCLSEDAPIVNDELSFILQQIDLLFDTQHKEVLGDEEFGTSYERYLYDMKMSNYGLKHIILSDLNSLDLMGYVPDVEVHLLQGTEKDIALIDITLTRSGESYKQIYKID